MTAPTLAELAADATAALKDAIDSDIAALRSIHRHLAILADDYSDDDEADHCLTVAADWTEQAIDRLSSILKKKRGTP